MKSSFYYFVIIFSTIDFAYCQKYNPGFIIVNGDTTKGYILDKNVSKSYESCTFKKTMNAIAEEYKPFEIDGYGSDDFKVYAPRRIPIDDSTYVNGFAEFVVYGSINFFIYKSQFFAEKDRILYQLRVIKTIIYRENEPKMHKRNEFHGILISLLTDCPDFNEKILESSLTEKSLSSVISDYNKCVDAGKTIVFKENIPELKFFYGFSGGYSWLNWGSSVASKYPSLDLNHLGRGQSFLVGLFLETRFPRFSRKLSVRTELMYLNAIKFNSQMTTTTPTPNETITYASEVGYSAIKLPILVKYPLNSRNKFDPYFNLGPTFNIISEKHNRQTITRQLGPIVNTEEKSPFTFSSLTTNLTLGLGTRYHLNLRTFFEFEARYEFGGSAVNGIQPFVFNTFDSISSFVLRMGKEK